MKEQVCGSQRYPKVIKGIPDMHYSYDNLFHGAARLGVLMNTLDLPWPCVTSYVSTFAQRMSAYQELSLDSAGTTLGLMTRGSGKDFAFRVAQYMETHSINEDRLRRFLIRTRFFEHRNLFFKVEINSEGLTEFSYYFRQRAPLEVARAWLADTGVDADGLALVDAVAYILEKRTIHFLAAAESPDGRSLQKVYFSQPDDGKAWSRVQSASELIGLNRICWCPLEQHRAALNNNPLFFSIAFAEGQICPGAKLDVQGVDTNTVEALMKEIGRTQEECDRTRLLVELFRKTQVDYLGLKFHSDAPFETKVYAYQSHD